MAFRGYFIKAWKFCKFSKSFLSHELYCVVIAVVAIVVVVLYCSFFVCPDLVCLLVCLFICLFVCLLDKAPISDQYKM